MKKGFIILLLLFVVATALYADYTDGMTTEQKRQYMSEALSVQEKMETVGSSSYFATSKYTAAGISSSSTNVKWDAYKGANPISKTEFFRLTGEESLLKEAIAIEERNAHRKQVGLGLTIGGTVGYIVGFAIMLSPSYDDPNFDSKLIGGAVVAILSCIPMGIGLYDLLYVEKQNVSASFAVGIADIYNQELAAKIKVSY